MIATNARLALPLLDPPDAFFDSIPAPHLALAARHHSRSNYFLRPLASRRQHLSLCGAHRPTEFAHVSVRTFSEFAQLRSPKSRLCSPPTSCSPTSQRDDPSLPIRSPDIKTQTTACDRGRVTSAIPSFATRDRLSIRGPDFAPPASSRTLHSLTKPKAPNQHVRLCKGPGG